MIKKEYLADFECNPGITEEQLGHLKLPRRLPADYLDLLKEMNGGEGDVGDEYLILDKAEQLLEINQDTEIADFDKDLFIIGGNGGGELIVIDFRRPKPKYVIMPYIFEYEAMIELGSSIEELFKRVHDIGYFNEES
jgi:hypothetical protein